VPDQVTGLLMDINIRPGSRFAKKDDEDPDSEAQKATEAGRESLSREWLHAPLVKVTEQLNEGTSASKVLIWTIVFVVFMSLYNALMLSSLNMTTDVVYDAMGFIIHSFPPTNDIMTNANLVLCGGVGQPKCAVRIEKILHQTYKSEQLLAVDHPTWAETPRRWKEAHPDWEYIFWSDQSSRDFIKKEYPWFLTTFDSYKKPIQRADAIRYFALYHYGGLYVDMDLTPKTNVEGLLQGSDVVLFETPNLGLTNMIMASKKGGKFIECVTHNLRYSQTKYTHLFGPSLNIMTTTGPTFLWGMTAAHNCGRFFQSNEEQLRIITPQVMGRCSCCKVNCDPSVGILNHLVGSSWHSWDSVALQQTFLCNPAPQMIFLITLFKLGRSLWNNTHSWTSLSLGKLRAYLGSADGIRQLIALFAANCFFQWRRYLGP
jgi:inositol phosphorylceramide mannosyltransferase catalytic subunit